MRIAEAFVFPVAVVENADVGSVREIARCAGGEEIALPAPLKAGRGFTGVRRDQPVVMDGIRPGDCRIVVRQRRADQLKMGPLEPDPRPPVRVRVKAEVPGVLTSCQFFRNKKTHLNSVLFYNFN